MRVAAGGSGGSVVGAGTVGLRCSLPHGVAEDVGGVGAPGDRGAVTNGAPWVRGRAATIVTASTTDKHGSDRFLPCTCLQVLIRAVDALTHGDLVAGAARCPGRSPAAAAVAPPGHGAPHDGPTGDGG